MVAANDVPANTNMVMIEVQIRRIGFPLPQVMAVKAAERPLEWIMQAGQQQNNSTPAKAGVLQLWVEMVALQGGALDQSAYRCIRVIHAKKDRHQDESQHPPDDCHDEGNVERLLQSSCNEHADCKREDNDAHAYSNELSEDHPHVRFHEPPTNVPVIIFAGFCNWSVRCAVLGFWNENDNPLSGILFSRHL